MFNAPKDAPTLETKTTFEETKDALNHTAHQAGHDLKEMYNNASAELTQASACMTKEIRANPIRSSAIALGVGVLLGVILRR